MAGGARLFPFWRLVPPPITERIRNGGFELGNFTYWTAYGLASIVTDPIHGGVYAALLGYVTSIRQTLTDPVPQSSIASFSVWIYGQDVLGQHSNAEITIFYSDGASTVDYFDAPNLSWLQVDLKPYVTVGKSVSGVQIRSWVDNAINLWVDDVSLRA